MARLSWHSFLPAILSVALALTLAFVDAQLHPHVSSFSTDSLTSLRQLNFQYQMAVEDLRVPEAQSSLISQLYQADALIPNQTPDRSNVGLIVTLKDSKEMMLLQPVEALSDTQLQQAAEDYSNQISEIAQVEIDQTVSLESPIYAWSSPAEDAPVALSSDDTATEALPSEEAAPVVTVGVIDSGVDETHPIFANTSFLPGWNTITNAAGSYDDVGHGTHIAGIVVSQAPGVQIAPYKIVDSNGGKLSNVLEAFSHAIDDQVNVINTSFGLSTSSYALESLVQEAYDHGVVVVSAAGNNGADTEFYPARYPQTIAVANVDMTGRKMPSSNYGNWVDVAAHGYHIRSSLPNNAYGYKSGTSQSAAEVSGAVARLLLAEPGLNFAEILDRLDASPKTVSEGVLAGTPIVE